MYGMYASDSATTGAARPGPMTATAMIATSSPGRAKSTFRTRDTAVSYQPPNHTALIARPTPATVAMAMISVGPSSVSRAPNRSRE